MSSQADGSAHFQTIAKIYHDAKEKYRIESLVPVFLAEDETALKKEVMWKAGKDELLGFCGKKVDHQCMRNNIIVVGNDENAYERLEQAFNDYSIGGHVRVILTNPIHVFANNCCILDAYM